MTKPVLPTIPPRVEEEGLRAYEQVRAFNAVRGKRLPLIYLMLSGMLFLASGVLVEQDRLLPGTGVLLVAIVASFVALFHWKRLEARHRTNLQFLTSLEMRYGDKLAWLQVEKHLKALEKLQAELKEEKGKGGTAAAGDTD